MNQVYFIAAAYAVSFLILCGYTVYCLFLIKHYEHLIAAAQEELA